VALVEWPTDVGEADGIADAIAGDIRSGRYSPADILVLTGRDTNGDRIRTALLARGIDAKSYFDQKAVDNDAANSALAFLRLVDNPDDAPALRLLLGAGSDTGRSAAYRKVIEVSRDERQTPAVVVERLSSGERLLKAPSLVACYNDAMERLPQLRLMDLPLLVAELMPGDVPDLADLRAIAVAALPGATSTSDFVKRVVVGVTQDEPPEHPDFVRVMSFHKSKGLTARSVHIVSAIAGIIPSDRAQWPDVAAMEAEEAEGRRLFYVAVTRAADSLVISWYSATTFQRARRDAITTRQPRTPHPRRGNSLEATFPSRFISELGASAPAPITGQAWLAARGI
jgi:superfamily I DNA/RNA helicase